MTDLCGVILVKRETARRRYAESKLPKNKLPIMSTEYTLFEACGILYSNGLRGCSQKGGRAMSDSKSVKMHYDVAGDDFDRAGEASAGLKRLLQKIGVPADIIRRIAIGTYEAEMNVIIHAGGGQVEC